MSAISTALSLMKVKHDRYKTEAMKEYNELVVENKFLKEQIKSTELRILNNYISNMPKAYRKRTMNRTVVRDILMTGTSHMGSTSCTKKCIELGIDPCGFEL